MTLIKWKPNNMIMNDFDYMTIEYLTMVGIIKQQRYFSPSVDIIEKDDEFILTDFRFDKRILSLILKWGIKINAVQDNNYSKIISLLFRKGIILLFTDLPSRHVETDKVRKI